MLSCKETTHLLSEAQDRPLDLRERFALKMHLLMCKGCANYQQQMEFIRQACARRNTHEKEERK
ncbi:MAG: zf-HC2 domain-containing protein [Rhodocyclaceae bacterium]